MLPKGSTSELQLNIRVADCNELLFQNSKLCSLMQKCIQYKGDDQSRILADRYLTVKQQEQGHPYLGSNVLAYLGRQLGIHFGGPCQ